jgi:acyl carrier protein
MTPDEIHTTVLRTLAEIAPEANLQHVKPDVSIRQQLDLDSMDFLNFILALHQTLGVEIPEKDYPQLATLQGCIDYLARSANGVRREGVG